MNRQHHDYELVPYPKLRQVLSVMMSTVHRKHMIHGLIEVDVTKAREFLGVSFRIQQKV